MCFLSDLHNKEYGAGNERLLDAICKARPDLILIGGDMLVGKKGCSFAPALEFVSKLPAIAPVYYACGNHEQRMKLFTEEYGGRFSAFEKKMKQMGVSYLENERVVWQIKGETVAVTGLDLPIEYYNRGPSEGTGKKRTGLPVTYGKVSISNVELP
mgnify:CR=1 FL=1